MGIASVDDWTDTVRQAREAGRGIARMPETQTSMF